MENIKEMSHLETSLHSTALQEDKISTAEFVDALGRYHNEEIERTRLHYAEQIRKLEQDRLRAEDKYSDLELSRADLFEQLRLDTTKYAEELITARENYQQLKSELAELKEEHVQMRRQFDHLKLMKKELSEVNEEFAVELKEKDKKLVKEKKVFTKELTSLVNEHEGILTEKARDFTIAIDIRDEKIQVLSKNNEHLQEKSEKHRGQIYSLESAVAKHQANIDALSKENERLDKIVVDQASEINHNTMLTEKTTRHHTDYVSSISSQVSTLQQEVSRYRSAIVEAERRADKVKNTLSFRLGYTLIHSPKSFKGTLALPRNLLQIRRDSKKLRKEKTRDSVSSSEQITKKNNQWLHEVENTYISEGLPAAENFIRLQQRPDKDTAMALTQIARLELFSNRDDALRLARESVKIDPRPFRRKWLAFLLFDSGSIIEAHELLLSLPEDLTFKPSEVYKAHYISGCYQLFTSGLRIPESLENPVYSVQRDSVLYIAASSRPFQNTGYTSRTHGMVEAISRLGWNVTCSTRPGYPEDRNDVNLESWKSSNEVKAVHYQTLAGPHRRKIPLNQYIQESAEIIAEKAREIRASVIHAASNYEAALPALIAARTLGIPFVYEVRGLWEYTAASRNPQWEETERFELDKRLENITAKNANKVFTLTQALADELVERGANKHSISLAPNAVNPNVFKPTQFNKELANSLGLKNSNFIIGYLGSVVAYEGLDDLISAFKNLVGDLPEARLVIVGDGSAMTSLESQVNALDLKKKVVLTGNVSQEDVNKYYSLFNVICLPRKPFKVCQLVSPLKPLEAMAMNIPLIVSDVKALKEMVVDGKTALVHQAGNPMSLAQCLKRLALDNNLALKIAKTARNHMLQNSTWTHVSNSVSESYSSLIEDSMIIKNIDPAKPISTHSFPTEENHNHAHIEIIPLKSGQNSLDPNEKSLLDKKINNALEAGGEHLLSTYLDKQIEGHSNSFIAFCQIKAANALLSFGNVEAAIATAETALANDPRVSTIWGVAHIYNKAALLDHASKLVTKLESMQISTSAADKQLIDEVHGRSALIKAAKKPTQNCAFTPIKKRVLNILAFSLPYTSIGYATRSHGLATGIQTAGWEIRPYTRPGFPYDFKPELKGKVLPLEEKIDGITYRRIFDINRNDLNEVDYLSTSIKCWESVIDKERPEVVHAASNYVTALPALIAARNKGVPFVYEVRGFWEITRSSRDKSFINTTKYRYMQLFEMLVAQHADQVITITTAMKEELSKRGVPESRIGIAFNSVDPERFLPRVPNMSLANKLGITKDVPVIGYVGSFVDYEGLDDLITAATGLKKMGLDFCLLLVGDGAIFEALQKQISDLDLNDEVILTGRVPHDEVEDYYSLIDIAPFPRKPWEVCELVSPLKPFEAMALQKAIVVSGTRALSEIVRHGENGLIFDKGDPTSLQNILQRLIENPQLRTQLGSNAREWITNERSWNVSGKECTLSYVNVTTPLKPVSTAA